MDKQIPVFEPVIEKEEIEAVVGALKAGEISGSFGDSIPNFENAFAKYVGVKHGIAVTSGTTALHLAVEVLDIKAGDEVLVSSCTNIATALAVYHHGAIPVPVDSEKDTWNMDLDLIEKLITPKTKGIIPVHIYGHPIDMDKLNRIAAKHKLWVVEDCAESHGATCRDKMTGSFGEMGCFSFYANKIITTGEGGMIVTNNDLLAEKLKSLRNLGFTIPRFRHETAAYNFRMTGMQAALGLAQFKKIDSFIDAKRKVASKYNSYLKNIPGIQIPAEASWAKNVYWMYGIVLAKDSLISRDALIMKLKEANIESRTFFCPMNLQPFLISQKGYRKIECPVAEELWEQGLYLPSSVKLSESEIKYISEVIIRSVKSTTKITKLAS